MGVSSFNILLGKMWVHRKSKTRSGGTERLPLSKLEPKSDIHGELSFSIQGRRVPFMGFVPKDDLPRDGACFPEWIRHLKKLVQTLMKEEQASYRFKEDDSPEGPFFEFAREGENAFFSLAWPAGNNCFRTEPAWEMVEFVFNDLLVQYFKFKDDFLKEIQNANFDLRDEWETKF